MTATQLKHSQVSPWRSSLPYLAWGMALIATTGSLFFSEVMRLPPCTLCWYQRIAMYPLVLILGIGIATTDPRARLYALPLAVTGWVIAAYHNLLYYKIILEGFTTCTSGVSCTSRQLEWLGFITIPLLSLTAFTLILVLLALYKPQSTEVTHATPTS